MSGLHLALEALYKKHKLGDEYPAETFRRALLSGEITEADFLKYRDVGKKAFNVSLFICGLEKTASVIKPLEGSL